MYLYIPYVPIFSIIEASITDPIVDASVCPNGNHECIGHTGIFISRGVIILSHISSLFVISFILYIIISFPVDPILLYIYIIPTHPPGPVSHPKGGETNSPKDPISEYRYILFDASILPFDPYVLISM